MTKSEKWNNLKIQCLRIKTKKAKPERFVFWLLATYEIPNYQKNETGDKEEPGF